MFFLKTFMTKSFAMAAFHLFFVFGLKEVDVEAFSISFPLTFG
jgi:hypothetical protein